MTQNEYFRKINDMKLCGKNGCKIAIPINQDSCYQCWRRKTRRAAKLSFAGFFVRPSRWYRLEEMYG